jgi:hypothetical protein
MRFIKELNGSFETNENETGYDMKKFKSTVRKMKNELTKEFGDVIENVKLSAGFFHMSGFFTRKRDNQVMYISIGDVRHGFAGTMLIRTAKDYKDYTGGSNNFIALEEYGNNGWGMTIPFEKRFIDFIK